MAEKELLKAISDMMDSKFEEFRTGLATKEDIANMATKEDIANMATKEDIANMATKDDIANMATKDDIANMATKDDIANMATKDDIASIRKEMANFVTKDDLKEALRKTENDILAEVDRVQGFSERHFKELKEEMSQFRKEVRSYNIGSLRFRVDKLEADVDVLKKIVL